MAGCWEKKGPARRPLQVGEFLSLEFLSHSSLFCYVWSLRNCRVYRFCLLGLSDDSFWFSDVRYTFVPYFLNLSSLLFHLTDLLNLLSIAFHFLEMIDSKVPSGIP